MGGSYFNIGDFVTTVTASLPFRLTARVKASFVIGHNSAKKPV